MQFSKSKDALSVAEDKDVRERPKSKDALGVTVAKDGGR